MAAHTFWGHRDCPKNDKTKGKGIAYRSDNQSRCGYVLCRKPRPV